MGEAHRTDEARDRAIVERIAAGQTLRSVAAAFGIAHSLVWRIADRAGVHSRCPSSSGSWPIERIEAFCQLHAEGLSLAAIARRLGVKSKSTVFKYAKRHRIVPPSPAVTTKDYAARNRAIVERIRSGVSCTQVAAEFGVSRGRVWQIVQAARASDSTPIIPTGKETGHVRTEPQADRHQPRQPDAYRTRRQGRHSA
jgi:transposase-like protein